MRVCIFGDSHVACFKQAWDALDEKPDWLSVDFIASPGVGLSALQAQGDHIVTANAFIADQIKLVSGGENLLRPSDYDAFLVIGLGLWVGPIADALTSAVVAQCWDDMVDASLSLTLGKLVRSLTRAPIYVAHNPLPAATAPSESQRSYADQYRVMKAAFQRHDIWLLPQPAETILLPFNTPADFSRGATRLAPDPVTGKPVLQPENDIHHMNAAYAQFHFRDFAKRLEADGLSLNG